MSLVGNLEDLSLGDIMQIISLSQKTGVLALHSSAHGEGRVVFRSGKVCAANLVGRAAPPADEAARQSEVEAIVLHMFSWPNGDFSFDVREEADPEDPGFRLEPGLNAQYLAMEGMRVRDEQARETASESTSATATATETDDPFADWDFADEVDGLEEIPPPQPRRATPPTISPQPEPAAGPEIEPEKEEPPAVAVRKRSRPLVLIDADSIFVGWAKHAFGRAFSQVHVFQQAEQGLSRIRQYLIRGQFPVVLISSVIEIDPLCGIQGVSDFVKRLKTQAPRLPIYCLLEEAVDGAPEPGMPAGAFDGRLIRPGRQQLQEWARTHQPGDAADFVGRLLVQLDTPVEGESARSFGSVD